jgi:hypothetical protein
MQNVVKLAPPWKALHTPWCHIIFGLWRVRWVHSRTQGLFPLVADGIVYHGYYKNCFSPTVDKEYSRGHNPFYIILSVLLLLGNDHENGICIWTMCDVGFKTMLLSLLHWTWVVITLLELWCILNYLWTRWNMWHVCWIMYDLGCMF